MEKYVGKTCPICQKQFEENDDVVVCPDCGTPHHRECYAQNGACAYQDKHDSMRIEEQIQKDEDEKKQQQTQSKKNDACYQCGMENAPEALFCNYCGALLHGDHQKQQQSTANTQNQFNKVFVNSAFGGMKPDDKIGDIPVKDFVVFLGPRANYYLPKFKAFSENRPISFNLSAFIVPEFYYIYRKMIPYSIIFWIFYMASAAMFLLLNFNNLYEAFLTASASNFIYQAYTVVWYIDFAFRLISCLFANKLYYHKAVKTIKKCQEIAKGNSQQYTSLLNKKGTVSVASVGVGSLIITMFVIVSFYIGVFLIH